LTVAAAQAILGWPVRATTPLRLLVAVLVAGVALAAPFAARAHAAPRIEDVEDALAHDRSFKVRADAAIILGRLRQTRSIPALVGALHDAHPVVRASAAQALGRIGSPIARDAVVKALNDPVPVVRHMARDALKLLGGEGAPPPPAPVANAPAIRHRTATRLSFEIKNMGDRSRKAGPALRSHMRDFLVDQLRPFGDVTPVEHQGQFAVDGVVKELAMSTRGPEVEVVCAVQLIVSRQPGGGVFMMTSGEATVLKPKRQWKPEQRASMELEAVESAVRAASEDLVRQLERQ
jgi:hypothetical protein